MMMDDDEVVDGKNWVPWRRLEAGVGMENMTPRLGCSS